MNKSSCRPEDKIEDVLEILHTNCTSLCFSKDWSSSWDLIYPKTFSYSPKPRNPSVTLLYKKYKGSCRYRSILKLICRWKNFLIYFISKRPPPYENQKNLLNNASKTINLKLNTEYRVVQLYAPHTKTWIPLKLPTIVHNTEISMVPTIKSNYKICKNAVEKFDINHQNTEYR